MATRAYIGVNNNGTIRGIYVHWDGYPSYTGKILGERYNNIEKVNELMDLGDLSSIATTIEGCDAYGRDKGESDTESREFSDVDSFIEQAKEVGCDVAYLYSDKKWAVKTHLHFVSVSEWTTLDEAIEETEN